mmetsp:Transcript_46147/g.142211  ORF Transcript_46147/g.142211 Transcript_46147/m.142211 type:complete len:216 (-) Transcript_46147:1648-2295(-)
MRSCFSRSIDSRSFAARRSMCDGARWFSADDGDGGGVLMCRVAFVRACDAGEGGMSGSAAARFGRGGVPHAGAAAAADPDDAAAALKSSRSEEALGFPAAAEPLRVELAARSAFGLGVDGPSLPRAFVPLADPPRRESSAPRPAPAPPRCERSDAPPAPPRLELRRPTGVVLGRGDTCGNSSSVLCEGDCCCRGVPSLPRPDAGCCCCCCDFCCC